MPKPGGAEVVDVLAGSAADNAGLQTGDVILKMADTDIAVQCDVIAFIGNVSAGSSVVFTVWRGGHSIVIPVQF